MSVEYPFVQLIDIGILAKMLKYEVTNERK